MSRLVLALTIAALPAIAAANAPPPDRFTPCLGKQAGDACFDTGCTCVEVQQGCPEDAGACLSCEKSGAWCGPTGYSWDPPGGCSCSAPGGALLAGALGMALLARRRRPPRAR
jgi:MYXO-CTERM domain-containing protein